MRPLAPLAILTVLAACDDTPPPAPTPTPKTEPQAVDPEPPKEPAPVVRENEPPKVDPNAPVEVKPIAPTEPHAFSALDVLAMDKPSDHQVSPDGTQVVFVRRTVDLEANKARTDLWTVPVGGGEPTRITDHPEADNNPRWAPDGSNIFFVSTRSGSPQIWKVAPQGGTATQVTDLPLPVGNLVVSPDGKHVAFTADVFVDCEGDVFACTKQRMDDTEASKRTGLHVKRLFVRHWDSYVDGRRSHLFLLPLAGGTPTDVTKGLDAHVPSRPFGGPEEITFSPDGESLVFAAKDTPGKEAWSTNFDLFSVPVRGGDRTNLTAGNPAWDTHPVFSPDGKSLVYLAMKRPGYESDRYGLMALPWPPEPGAAAREVAPGWDRSVETFVFAPDGTAVVASAQDIGQTSIFRIDLASGGVAELVDQGTNGHPKIAGERLVFDHHDLTHPAELYTAPLAGGEIQPLTELNKDKAAAAKMGKGHQFSFKGAKGDTVYGYVVEPVDLDPGQKYPVAFLIHGGPQGSFGNMFHDRWNPQVYAGAGYGVVMIDFHGSTGYGQAFTDAIRDDWGGKPLEDLRKGLAAAAQNFAWLDTSRACALGASYGGFMINWIAGQWPDGFRCLVNHDGLFDQRMMYYSTEELWFPEWEHMGPYWERVKNHEKHNPVNFVSRWKTPMLVVHGGLDFRVPPTQGLATFSALQQRGIESEMLFFPDENHWVLHQANRLQWHEVVLDWLQRHTAAPQPS